MARPASDNAGGHPASGRRPASRPSGAAFDRATDASWASRGAMQLKAEAYELAYRGVPHRGDAEQPQRRSALRPDGGGGRRPEAARNAGVAEDDRVSRAGQRPGPDRDRASAGGRRRPRRRDRDGVGGGAAGARRSACRPSSWRRSSPTPGTPTASSRWPRRWPRGFPTGRIPATTRPARSFCAAGPKRPSRRSAASSIGHPDHARAQNLLGAACATLGRRECAQSAFEASLRADPRDPSTYINLGALPSSGRQSAGGRAATSPRRLSIDASIGSRAFRPRAGSFALSQIHDSEDQFKDLKITIIDRSMHVLLDLRADMCTGDTCRFAATAWQAQRSCTRYVYCSAD